MHGVALGLVGVGLALAAGCGNGHPPTSGLDFVPDGGGPNNRPPNQFDYDASFAPPKCEVVTSDGGICGCTDVPLQTDAPTIYFVLDRSGSMTADNKWQTVRSVTQQLVTAIGARANFGAAVFPNPSGDDCTPGLEVMRPRRGDAPAGTAGFTTRMLAAATNVVATGGTPTAQTLRNIQQRLVGITGRVYVILATDGGPNCNARAACDATSCIPNLESAAAGCVPNTPPSCCTPATFGVESCLDAQPTVDAVTALHTAGIDTYVVGVPGSGPYAGVLDQLAKAGNTARTAAPFYYKVDTAGEAALLTALSQIAAKIVASCTLPLSGPPANPNLVNVYLDEQPVPKDPVNGWTLDNATITLVGATCDKVMSGAVLDVRVIEGCPTVSPK